MVGRSLFYQKWSLYFLVRCVSVPVQFKGDGHSVQIRLSMTLKHSTIFLTLEIWTLDADSVKTHIKALQNLHGLRCK